MATTEPWRNPRPAPNLDEVRDRISTRSWLLAFLNAWWPALLWAAFIFVLSTDTFSSEHTEWVLAPIIRWFVPSITGTQLEIVHHCIRKSAHFVEYFIFFILLYRGLRGFRGVSRGWYWSYAVWAWLIAAAYSALDEIHQIFVPSRGPSALDSLIDSTGALIALLVLFLVYRRWLRPRSA